MELIQVGPSQLAEILGMQKEGFKQLFEKYQDKATSPYMEEMETIQRKFKQKNSFYYFIVANEKNVGFVRLVFNDEQDKARISPIVLLPKYQSLGLGKEAMLLLEKEFSQVKEWHLDTILQEPKLVNFYLSLGYQKLAQQEEIQPNLTIAFFKK